MEMDHKNGQVMDQQLKQELDQIKKLAYGIDAKMTSMEAFLSGNELDKDDKGLVGRVNDQEKRLKKLEKQRDIVMYFLAFTSFPTGIGVFELVQKFILK